MVRAHILFQEDQYQFLKTRAREAGVSVSALVRDVVERLRHHGGTAGRQGMSADPRLGFFVAEPEHVRNGVPLLPSRPGERPVSMELVNELRDQD